jgi:hypothetical protein
LRDFDFKNLLPILTLAAAYQTLLKELPIYRSAYRRRVWSCLL